MANIFGSERSKLILAIVLIIVAALLGWWQINKIRSTDEAFVNRGTIYFKCDCGNTFSMTSDELRTALAGKVGGKIQQSPTDGSPIRPTPPVITMPCPACGKEAPRAWKCKDCGMVFLPEQSNFKCPQCGWSLQGDLHEKFGDRPAR